MDCSPEGRLLLWINIGLFVPSAVYTALVDDLQLDLFTSHTAFHATNVGKTMVQHVYDGVSGK